MYKILGTTSTRIKESWSNPPQSIMLPGSNGMPKSSLQTDYTIYAVVVIEDTNNVPFVYLGIDGGSAIDGPNGVGDGVASDDYPVIFVARKTDWSWSYSNGKVVIPTNSVVLNEDDIDATGNELGPATSYFQWNFPSISIDSGVLSSFDNIDQLDNYFSNNHMFNMGNLSDFGWSNGSSKDAYVYVSGTGNYGNVNSPAYPDPVKITLPNIRIYLNYYPWAIRKSGLWNSCNRTTGCLKIRRTSWQECKNTDDTSATNKGFIRESSWKISAKIGTGA